jgi:hypothetical protein
VNVKSGIILPLVLLLPNVFWALFPSSSGALEADESIALTILENIGRIGILVIPIFYSIDLDKPYAKLVIALMAIALLIYYAAWGRYFIQGRPHDLLTAPLAGIPIPLATAPVVFTILSSYVLDSWPMLVASLFFGVVHIYISAT